MTRDAEGRDDASLVAGALRGSGEDFEALVRRHYRAAYAVALAQMGNGMDAEDVCQDAFVRALERLEDCRHPDRFGAWLLKIVRNRAHNYREYRRIRTGVPLEHARGPVAGGSSAPDVRLERRELRDALEQALRELPEVQREVLLLHELEGWKHARVAEALGLSVGMSRQHLMNARRALRDRLGQGVAREHGGG